MRSTKILVAAVLALSLTACEGTGPKEGFGTLLGGIGGAVAGSQFGSGRGQLVGVAAGTLLGAFLGREVGKSLDRADIAYAEQANTRAQSGPIGQQIAWSNPQTGNSGTVVPVREGTDRSGAYCREFQQTVVIGGKSEQAYGQACRQPDGSWKVVD